MSSVPQKSQMKVFTPKMPRKSEFYPHTSICTLKFYEIVYIFMLKVPPPIPETSRFQVFLEHWIRIAFYVKKGIGSFENQLLVVVEYFFIKFLDKYYF